MRKILSHVSALLVCFLVAVAPAYAGGTSLKRVDFKNLVIAQKSDPVQNVGVELGKTFVFSRASLQAAFGEGAAYLQVDAFPIAPGKTETVFLRLRRSVIDAQTVVMVGDKVADVPQVHTYAGFSANSESKIVLSSSQSGELFAVARSVSGATYELVPSSDDPKAEGLQHSFLEAKGEMNGKMADFARCATDEHDFDPRNLPSDDIIDGKFESPMSKDLLELQIVLETTTAYFNGPGGRNQDRAMAYAIALMNMNNIIYEDETNMTTRVVRFQMWTDVNADPYQNDGVDNAALLNEVESRWQNSQQSRDLVHVLTTPGTTRVLGIASGLGGICRNRGGGALAYSVSGIGAFRTLPTLGYSEEVTTIAHEIGHNFGAAHTHNCSFWRPAFDSCMSTDPAAGALYSLETCNPGPPILNAGSIMSYCHLFGRGVSFTFIPRVAALMRSNAERFTCVAVPPTPTVLIQSPLGNQTLTAGANLSIRWTTQAVQNVAVEYSADNMKTWRTISASTAAKSPGRELGQGGIPFTLPTTLITDSLYFRVYDISNPQVADTSWAPLRALTRTIALTDNVQGQTFGQAENVRLEWRSTLVSAVRVEISYDGGKTWQAVSGRLTASTFVLDMPNVDANGVLVRVVDADDNTLVSQAGPFSIAKETLTLDAPATGDSICAGRPYLVRWKVTNVGSLTSRVRIQFRTSPTGNWGSISSVTAASAGQFSWAVPRTLTGTIQVRVTYSPDTSIQVLAQNIRILDSASCLPSSVSEFPVELSDVKVSPNPSTGLVELSGLPGVTLLPVSVSVVNALGERLVDLFGVQSQASQTGAIQIDLSGFAAGQYFVVVSSGLGSKTLPVSILR